MLVATLILCGCAKEQSSNGGVTHFVVVVSPEINGGISTKHLAGRTCEQSMTNVAFKTPGQLKEIAVKEGQYVSQGQLLARLDDADYQLGVDAYQIQYDQLSEEVRRLKMMMENNGVAANDYEKAEAGLRQLAIQLQVNKNKVAYTRLYSPVNGYVNKVTFETAEMVDAGTPVFEIINTSNLEVEVSVPVAILQQKNNFESLYAITDKGANEKRHALSIKSIVPKADANQLYTMRLTFNENPKQIAAGTNVDVLINIVSEDSTLYSVPLHAVFEHQGKECVWTVDGQNTVHAKQVVVKGIDSHGNALISSGINKDDRIVKAGVEQINEGESVGIKDIPSETNVGGLM